jgi:ubiquinone/menaquinone biosynthesis C-methylase UbiE
MASRTNSTNNSTNSTTTFDGTAGRLAGRLMARMNRDMELAAIDELAPAPDASVLAVGFGPGVGVTGLTRRLPGGVVGGVDPSAVMVQQARRRNLAAVERGQVSLECSTADSIPWPDATFTGVIAVNSLQLWDPLDASVREVVRVLAPTGRFCSSSAPSASPPMCVRRSIRRSPTPRTTTAWTSTISSWPRPMSARIW